MCVCMFINLSLSPINTLGLALPTFCKSNGRGSNLQSHMLLQPMYNYVSIIMCFFMCVWVFVHVQVCIHVSVYDMLYVCGCGL